MDRQDLHDERCCTSEQDISCRRPHGHRAPSPGAPRPGRSSRSFGISTVTRRRRRRHRQGDPRRAHHVLLDTLHRVASLPRFARPHSWPVAGRADQSGPTAAADPTRRSDQLWTLLTTPSPKELRGVRARARGGPGNGSVRGPPTSVRAKPRTGWSPRRLDRIRDATGAIPHPVRAATRAPRRSIIARARRPGQRPGSGAVTSSVLPSVPRRRALAGSGLPRRAGRRPRPAPFADTDRSRIDRRRHSPITARPPVLAGLDCT